MLILLSAINKDILFEINSRCYSFVSVRFFVESASGSQPICNTLYPRAEKAADRFEVVVDLPIPPFPYIAILLIIIPFCYIKLTYIKKKTRYIKASL